MHWTRCCDGGRRATTQLWAGGTCFAAQRAGIPTGAVWDGHRRGVWRTGMGLWDLLQAVNNNANTHTHLPLCVLAAHSSAAATATWTRTGHGPAHPATSPPSYHCFRAAAPLPARPVLTSAQACAAIASVWAGERI